MISVLSPFIADSDDFCKSAKERRLFTVFPCGLICICRVERMMVENTSLADLNNLLANRKLVM